MVFRQFITITVFSALLGAGMAKLMVGPAPAQSYVIGPQQPVSAWPVAMGCKTRNCR